MLATKIIAKRLKDPNIDPNAKEILGELINALDGRDKLDIAHLFKLEYNDFELSLRLLGDWRLQQYRIPAGGLRQAIKENHSG